MHTNKKNVVLTGATGGLGIALSKAFLSENHNLVLIGTSNKKLESLQKQLQSDFPASHIQYFQADFSSEASIENLIQMLDIVDVDILINNAGVFDLVNIENSTNEDFSRTMNINVRAPFLLSKYAIEKMKPKKWGRIVNVGSSSAYNGSPDSGLYCISKHALLGLSRSLYQELKKYNINTYSVCPGSIQTPMGASDKRQDYSTFLCPDEIAKYILFLLSFNSNGIVDELRINRIVVR